MKTTPSQTIHPIPQLILLDRDGTINVDRGPSYLTDPKDLQIFDGLGPLLVALKSRGTKIVITSNQAGLGKGRLSLATLNEIHRYMEHLLSEQAGDCNEHPFRFDGIEICPHLPEEKCLCRKPMPGLLLSALSKTRCSPQHTLYVGDHLKDLQAAASLKIPSYLVRTGYGAIEEAKLKTNQPLLDELHTHGFLEPVDTLKDALQKILNLN